MYIGAGRDVWSELGVTVLVGNAKVYDAVFVYNIVAFIVSFDSMHLYVQTD